MSQGWIQRLREKFDHRGWCVSESALDDLEAFISSIFMEKEAEIAKLNYAIGEWKKEEDMWNERERDYQKRISTLEAALKKIADGKTDAEFKASVRGLSEEAFYEAHYEWCQEIAKAALSTTGGGE